MSSSKEVYLGWAWPNQRRLSRKVKCREVTSADQGDSKQPMVSCMGGHMARNCGRPPGTEGRPG